MTHLLPDGRFLGHKYVVLGHDPAWGPHYQAQEADETPEQMLQRHVGSGRLVDVSTGKFVLSFTDPLALSAIALYAGLVRARDPQLSADLAHAVAAAGYELTTAELDSTGDDA